MSGRGLRPVARAVDRLLRGLGIAADVARVDAVDAWPAVVTAALGPDAAATRAIRVDGTTLVVSVPTSAWASELRLRQEDLLRRLTQAAPRSGISSIRTVPAHSGRATPPSSEQGSSAP